MSDLTVKGLSRVFKYGSLELDDPDPDMKPEDVKDFWGDVYPELTQAVIEGPEFNEDRMEYTFRKAVGTKGAIDSNEEPSINIDESLDIMRQLASILSREYPGAEAYFPPSSVLEPV